MATSFKHLRRFLLAFLGAALISPAYAAVLFTIERIDDTHGRLVTTGTLGATAPTGSNGNILALTNPFATEPNTDPYPEDSVPVLAESELKVGGRSIDYAFAAPSAFDLFGDLTAGLYFGTNDIAPFLAGALLEGYLDLELGAGATFAAAGSQGQVFWGVVDNPQLIGEWIIVDAAVPEPGNLALGAIALAALLAARRRRVRS